MADKAVHAEQARLVFWTKSKLPQKNSIVPGMIDSGNMYPHVSEGLTNKVKAVMPVVQSTVEDVNSQSPRTQSLGSLSMSQHVLDTAVCKQVTTASVQGVTLRNLCMEDKKPVANLIKEPAILSRDCHRSREENDHLENLAWKRLGDQILLAKARREQWLRRFEESSEKDSLAPGVNDLGNMEPCVSGGRTKELKAVIPVVQSTVEDVNAQSPRTQSLDSSSMSQHVLDTAACKQVTTASVQGVTLRNLCMEDKKPVANLIREPASLSRDCHRSREENDNAENNLTVKMKRLDDQIQLVVTLRKQWLKGIKELSEKDSLVPGVNDLGNMQPCVSGGHTKEIKAVMPVLQSTVEDTQSLGSSSMSQPVSDTAMCKQVTTAGSQGVSPRNLCMEDKKPVTNLIKEPASLSRDCRRSREENDNEENNLTVAWKRLGDHILLAKARREQWLMRFKESSEKDSLVPGVNDLGNMQPCVSGGHTKEIKAVMPVLQSTVEDTQSLGSSSMSQHVLDTAACKQVTTASVQGVTLRNLCMEDKKPVANLIREPASLSRDCHRSREENDNAENNLTVKMKRLDDQIQLVVTLQKQWLKGIKELSEKDSLVPGVNDLGNMQPCVSGGHTKEIKAVMPVLQSTVEDTQSLGSSSMSQPVSDTAMCKQVTTAGSQGVSPRNLCMEDKKPVTNLIKEPASLSRDCRRSREENDNEENNLTVAWKRLGDHILLAKARREQWLMRFKESSEKDSLVPGVNDLGNMQPCVSGGHTKEIKAVMPVLQSTVEDTQSLGSSSMSQHVLDTAVCKQVTTARGQGVSLRNLCMEDKKPVTNLIKEPASLSRDCHRSREENDNAENNLTVKLKRLDDQIKLIGTQQEQRLKGFKESSEKDSLVPRVNDHGNMQPCVSGERTKEIKAVMPVVQSTVEDTQPLGSSSDYKTHLLVVDDRETKVSDRIDTLSKCVEIFSSHYLDEQALLEKLKQSMEAINQQNIDNILINKRLQQEVKEYYRMQLEEQMSLTREDQKVARQLQEQLHKRQQLEKRLEYAHKEPGDQPHPANSKPAITNNSRLTEVVILERGQDQGQGHCHCE